MASTVLNVPSSVRRINGLDCGSYVGLRHSPDSNFLCVRTSANVRSPRLFVVRASDGGDAPMKKLGRSDAECEAAVVAGNVPEAPPVPPKPASPAGTPVVPLLPLSRRPRRNRRSPALRASFQETNLSPANFVRRTHRLELCLDVIDLDGDMDFWKRFQRLGMLESILSCYSPKFQMR